jgi:hypothetical protein
VKCRISPNAVMKMYSPSRMPSARAGHGSRCQAPGSRHHQSRSCRSYQLGYGQSSGGPGLPSSRARRIEGNVESTAKAMRTWSRSTSHTPGQNFPVSRSTSLPARAKIIGDLKASAVLGCASARVASAVVSRPEPSGSSFSSVKVANVVRGGSTPPERVMVTPARSHSRAIRTAVSSPAAWLAQNFCSRVTPMRRSLLTATKIARLRATSGASMM